MDDVVALYKTVGHRDIRYLKWLHTALDSMPLPCIDQETRPLLGEDKTKVSVFDIMQDDLADNLHVRDGTMLEDFIKIPWHKAEGKQDFVRVGQMIWDDFFNSVRNYPRFDEFVHVFNFDWRQIISANLYSYLVNTHGLDNSYEMNHYSSYGLCVMLFIDMDLMQLVDFDMKELGRMRSISFLAQRVVRIANMLATYPREVVEHDLSSPIISLARRRGLIAEGELGDLAILKKLQPLEGTFRDRAKMCIEKISTNERRIRSINIVGFAEMLRGFVDEWGKSPETRIVLQEQAVAR